VDRGSTEEGGAVAEEVFFSAQRVTKMAQVYRGTKKPQERRSAGKKTLRKLGSFWGPSEEIITALDPIRKILELQALKKNENAPGFF
jgi:hypothetical protein